MKVLANSIKFMILSFLLFLIFRCSDSNYFDGVLSVSAFGNWPNFNGAVLKSNKAMKGASFTLTPKEFFIDIRTVKIKSDNG